MEPEFYIGRKVTIRDSGSPYQYTVVALSGEQQYALLANNGVYERTMPLDRLEVLPVDKRYSTGAFERGYRPVSSIAVTNDEALEFFMFTMLQAAMLFELVPSFDPHAPDDSRAELERLLIVRGESSDGPCVTSSLAYYDAAAAWYAADKEKYPDE